MQAERTRIGVKCAISDAPEGDRSVKQMIPDGVILIHDFKALTPDGAQLEVLERRDEALGSNSRRFTERQIRSDGSADFGYQYEVEPGAWMDESMQPSGGQRFGYFDGRVALVSGRNLFLLPSFYDSLSKIEVHFHLPNRWRVVGTLPVSDGRAQLAGIGLAAASLVDSVIGLGEFEEMDDPHGRDGLRFYASSFLPESTRREVFRVAREGFAILEKRLGPLGHDYSVVLVARPEDDSLILIPSSPAGQGSEVSVAGPVEMYDLLFSMARAFTVLNPSVFRFAEHDLWMQEALPAYYAVRAQDAIGLRTQRASWRLRSYAAATTRSFLQDLSRDGEEDQAAARAKGAHVLAIAESLLGGGREGAEALDGVVRRLKESASRGTFINLLDRTAPGSDLSILHQLVATNGAIPKDWIARVAGRVPFHLLSTPDVEGTTVPAKHLKVLLTANTNGMLEVCGCKARQLGGIARRETIRRRALLLGGSPILVDLGNAYANPPDDPILNVSEQKELDLALELMGRQGYAAAAIGHAEMLRGPAFFLDSAGRKSLPYVNSNLAHDQRPLAPPFRITHAAGLRIAWVSVLDPGTYNQQHARFYEENLDGLSIGAPLESLAQAARKVRPQVDLVIAIGSLAPDLVREALDAIPEIDAYLSSDSVEAVFNGALSFAGDTNDAIMGFRGRRLVYFSIGEGKMLEELDLGVRPGGGLVSANLTRHRLSEDVPDDPRFRGRLAAFYDGIKKSPDLAGSEEPVAQMLPSLLKDARYTGAAACQNCHREQFMDWQASPHGYAFSVLLLRHRNYAPRCVGCHVTGFGLQSGYRVGDPLERLRHVQCEMCHGPGSLHSARPSQQNIVKRPPREACFECHTSDHSDMNAENFDTYYERTIHKDLFAAPPDDTP